MKKIVLLLSLVFCLSSFAVTPKAVMEEARNLRQIDNKNYLPSGDPAYYQHANLDKAFARYRDVLSMTNATPADKIEALRQMAECRLDIDLNDAEAEKLFVQAILLPGLSLADEAKAEFNRADCWRRKGDYAGALYQYGRFLAMTNAPGGVRSAALDGCILTRADRDGWEKALAWAETEAPEKVRSWNRLAWHASRAKLRERTKRYVDLTIAHELVKMPNGRYRGYPNNMVAEYLGMCLGLPFETFAAEAEHYVAETEKYYVTDLNSMLPPIVEDRWRHNSRSVAGRDLRFLPFMEKLIARCPDEKKRPGLDKYFAFAQRAGNEQEACRYAEEILKGTPAPALRLAAETQLALARAGTDGKKAADEMRGVIARCAVTNGEEQAKILKDAIQASMAQRPRRFEVASALFRLREKMYARPAPKRTTCPFVKDAPEGAAAILASDVWKNAKKEVFDRPYGDSLQVLIDSDVSVSTRAKTVYRGEKFRPTEMAAFCDASGVKILMRSYTDPAQMARIADGFEHLTPFEAYIAFDDEGPYQQFFTTGRSNVVGENFVTQYDNGTGWRRPTTASGRLSCERYRLADGAATLFTVSWENVFASLPSDGDSWRFECFDWQYGGWSWSGTTDVHGRSQMGAVVFSGLDAAAKTAIRRRLLPLVKASVDDARNADKAGVLDFWKDPYVGDRAFYEAKLAGLEADLVAATKRIKADMSDADVNEVWDAAGVTALNLKYVISKLRTDYLTAKRVAGAGDGFKAKEGK